MRMYLSYHQTQSDQTGCTSQLLDHNPERSCKLILKSRFNFYSNIEANEFLKMIY